MLSEILSEDDERPYALAASHSTSPLLARSNFGSPGATPVMRRRVEDSEHSEIELDSYNPLWATSSRSNAALQRTHTARFHRRDDSRSPAQIALEKHKEKRERHGRSTSSVLKIAVLVIALLVNLVVTPLVLINDVHLKHQPYTIDGVTLWRWLVFFDVASFGFLVIALMGTLVMLVLSKLAHHYNFFISVFYRANPYETPAVLIIWATLFATIRIILGDEFESGTTQDKALVAFIMIFLIIGVVMAVKNALYFALEAYLFREVADETFKWVKTQQMLMALEGFGGKLKSSDVFSSTNQRLASMSSVRSGSIKNIRDHRDKGDLTAKEASIESARAIIKRIAPNGKTNLLTATQVEALMQSFSKAAKIVEAFDLDKDGALSEDDLAGSILRLWKDRKLIQSIRSQKELLLSVSNRVLSALAAVTLFVVVLILSLNAFIAVDWGAVSTSIGAFLLAVSFAYADTMQQLFDSFYMLFFVRPFNVGDRIIITTNEINYSSGCDECFEELIVEEVGVLTTYFHNASTGCGVFVRNADISTSTMVNLSRGGRISIKFNAKVHPLSSPQQLSKLKHRIERSLFTDKIFSPKINLWVESIHATHFTIQVSVRTRQRWRPRRHDWKELRSQLLLEVDAHIKEVGIHPDSEMLEDSDEEKWDKTTKAEKKEEEMTETDEHRPSPGLKKALTKKFPLKVGMLDPDEM